jgi:hypothetical protein
MQLDADGGGTVDLQYRLYVPAEDDYARFASILEIHPRELGCDPRAEIQPKNLSRELLEPFFNSRGVEILECTRKVDGEWDTVALTLEFSHIDSLSFALTSATERYSGSFQIAEMQAGSFMLMFDRSIPPTELYWQWFPDAPVFPPRVDAKLDSLVADSKEYAMSYLYIRGNYLSSLFRAKLEMELPSIPIRHNADKLEGKKCTWEFGPEDVDEFKVHVTPFAEFPGEGLRIVARKSRK